MRSSVRLAAGLVAFAAALPAFAQDAHAWLARMDRAMREMDYVGTFVYSERRGMETLQVFHRRDGDGARERLVSLTGEPREVVRADERVTCIGTAPTPRAYEAAPGGGMFPALAANDARSLAQYQVALAGDGRIAGRAAQIVDVRARDAYRYGYRLWLDRDTGMLLKSLRVGLDGIPVEQIMFTELEFVTPSDQQLAAGQPADDARVARAELPAPAEAATQAAAAWRVQDPPPGFTLTLLRPAQDGGEEHQVYSDGVASVSVYIEPAERGVIGGNVSQGAISSSTRRIGAHRVFVIGDVPELTAQRFAQAVAASGS